MSQIKFCATPPEINVKLIRKPKKIKRYSKLQNTTINMKKVKFIAEQYQEDEESVTDEQRRYLESHLSTFKIDIDEFLRVSESTNFNTEEAFENIKQKKKLHKVEE